jgi:hypothetical protein
VVPLLLWDVIFIVTAKTQLHRQIINNMVLLVGLCVCVLGLLVLLLLVLRMGVHVPVLLGSRRVCGTSLVCLLVLLLSVGPGVHVRVGVICGRGAGWQRDLLLLLRVVLRVGGGVRAVVVEVTVVSLGGQGPGRKAGGDQQRQRCQNIPGYFGVSTAQTGRIQSRKFE